MKKTYVPVTLDAYLNESKTITLKRGYGEKQPVVVGANAPLRNQVLTFVGESQKVTKTDLKRFIAGLNEGSKNPVAAANMWLQRNSKFFITENKNGITYYKLSTIGKRLSNRFVSNGISESVDVRKKIDENKPGYDFVDRKKGYARPGIYDMDENDESCEVPEEDENEIDESTKIRIKRIIENIKAKRANALNEEEGDEEKEEKGGDEDELTFDDLDLGDEEKEEGEDDELEGDDEEKEEGDDEEKEEGEDDDNLEDSDEDTGEEKVEITEFIITVDNVEEAISELSELGVDAEQVVDEEEEEIENQIKVSADDWDSLKGWLEEKGVDVEEMFGGEIEVEDEEKPEGDLEDTDEFDLEGEDDLGGEDDLEGGLDDLDLGGGDDLKGGELNLGDEDVEESFEGMEDEEKNQVPNLVSGRQKQTPNVFKAPNVPGKTVTITVK